MGTTQVQAPTATTEGRSGLAGTRGPFIAGPICSLAASVWPRPNTGSRMSREVHVRFWERAGVRFPRATRLPLYRQCEIYAREGLELDRSTLCDWVGQAAWLLDPIVDAILPMCSPPRRYMATT